MMCPRCDNQGDVVVARIKKTGELVHLCDECDALWTAGQKIEKSNFVDFSTYVEQFGLSGTWQEIEVVTNES